MAQWPQRAFRKTARGQCSRSVNRNANGREGGERGEPEAIVEARAGGGVHEGVHWDVIADDADPHGVGHPPIEAGGPVGGGSMVLVNGPKSDAADNTQTPNRRNELENEMNLKISHPRARKTTITGGFAGNVYP